MKKSCQMITALLACVILFAGCDPVSMPEDGAANSNDEATSLRMAGPQIAEASKRLAVDSTGAVPGVWTSDLDAAVELAVERKLPLLLFFNGSDWSFAANSFVANVLESPQWRQYAPNLVLVMIDLHKNSPDFPQELLQRNRQLRGQLKVNDIPTILFCNSDGAPMANLRANAMLTADQFIVDVKLCTRQLPAKIDEMVAATANPEIIARYGQLKQQRQNRREMMAQFEQKMRECENEINRLGSQLEDDLLEWSISQLPTDKQAQCRQAMAENAAANRELKAFLDSKPAENSETVNRFRDLRKRIETSQEIVNRLIVE